MPGTTTKINQEEVQIITEDSFQNVKNVSAFFFDFVKNISRAKNRKMSDKLKKLITPNDLAKIYDHIENNLQPFATLVPGKGTRISKKQSKLPRTFVVNRTIDGEYQLIVETKSKLAYGKLDQKSKKEMTIQAGYKTGKSSFRVDLYPGEEYFSSVTRIQNQSELQNTLQEIQIAQGFKSPLIKYTDGIKFQSNTSLIEKLKVALNAQKGRCTSSTLNEDDLVKMYQAKFPQNTTEVLKVAIYSKREKCDLQAYLSHEYTRLSDENKNILVLDVLRAIKVLHDENLVHQDIKPSNFLVDHDNRLMLTDFFTCKEEGKLALPIATRGYQSPEMAYLYTHFPSNYLTLDMGNFLPSYFNEFDPRSDYVNQYKKIYPLDHLYQPQDFAKVSKENDMWSAGIVIFEILCGQFPMWCPETTAKIENHELLKHLLVGPTKRATIDEAIQIHQRMISFPTEESGLKLKC